MAPARATAWPASICQDPDVLALDAYGHFVLCRVCFDHYVLFGGKKPRRVHMNACFRTCAWETHKRRTRAHNPVAVQARYKSESSINEVSKRLSYIRSLTSSIASVAERVLQVPPTGSFESSPTLLYNDNIRPNGAPRGSDRQRGSSLAEGLASRALHKSGTLPVIDRAHSESPDLAPKIAAMDISQLLNPVDCESDVELRGARDHDASNSPSPPQNVSRLIEKYSAHVSPWQSKERARYDDGFWERRFINSSSEMDDSQAIRQPMPLRRTPVPASRDISVAFMCATLR